MRIVITGATSGIGEELAAQYSAGGVTLGLTGRRKERLDLVAERCRAKGATVHVYPVSVNDRAAMAALATDFAAKAGGVDLVIANSGTGCPDRLESGQAGPIADVLETNVIGVTNTLVPFVPIMIAQGRGHLVAVASVAGFRAMPGHTVYSASKMAVRCLMEGFGMRLEPRGIACTTINPGFVESEMTAKNRFKMPFILTTEQACVKIRRAIAKKRRVYTFPGVMAFLARVLAVAPRWLVVAATARRASQE
jgi:short-subunit dehydrogenase